jgi:hypothetical protein
MRQGTTNAPTPKASGRGYLANRRAYAPSGATAAGRSFRVPSALEAEITHDAAGDSAVVDVLWSSSELSVPNRGYYGPAEGQMKRQSPQRFPVRLDLMVPGPEMPRRKHKNTSC